MFPAALPANVEACRTGAPEAAIATLPAGSFILVMTHDHQIDFDIVETALRRDDFVGIGLIGSDTKRARFVSRLRRHGIPETALDRLICPIGVPGIVSKQPEAIAIAVAAQILQGITVKQKDIPVALKQPVACNTCFRSGAEVCA
jgi:xanthine dehydrogenase accessory factor